MRARLQLGLEISPETFESMAAIASAAEIAGFGILWLAEDHHDPLPLAGALAEATSSLGIGVVASLDSSRRHPAILARDVTTLDVLSDGRAALMLIGDDPEELAEAAKICHALFTSDESTIEGEHYRIAGAVNRPRPRQPSGPPLVVNQPVVGRPVVDAWAVTGDPEQVRAHRRRFEGTLLWRGDVSVTGVRDLKEILAAGADGLIVRGVQDPAALRDMLER